MRVERIAIVATAADLPFRERREESVVERGVHEADFPRARRWPRGRREDVSSPGFWPREETGICYQCQEILHPSSSPGGDVTAH
jgi:hypothetical protein